MLQSSQNLPFQGQKRSQQFIEKYRKKLSAGPAFYNPDTTLMPAEEFEKAKCRILIVFPTPYENKTVSKTDGALNDFVIEHLPNCFVDFAYQPEPSDCALYDNNNIPYAIGHITHLDPSYFDIIGFSISVLCDIPNTAVMLKTFERCDKSIPLFWSDRKSLSLKECPLIYAGGITAAYSDVLFGEVDGKQAFLDFLYLGECDKTDVLVNRYIEARDKSTVTRKQEDHYVLGKLNDDIPNFESVISDVNTIQDYIDTLFDCQFVYQPQAYEVKFDEHRRIISNIKINPKANDFVTPYYPHEMPPDLGLGRMIINANGQGTGECETQVSNGCSASGICSFCAEGVYCAGWTEKSKEQILKEVRLSKMYSAAYSYKPFSFNANYLRDYKGMLLEFMKIIPRVTFINQRMEELGRDVDAIKMMKLTGSNRLAAPIEGLSPRVQNNLLNKCLSEQSLKNVMEDVIHQKLLDLKVGAIRTCYEEMEDIDWICDYLKSVKQKADAEGGNLPIRLNTTPLVHYPLTVIEFLERKTAKRSYDEERWYTDEEYQKFKDADIRVKIHGFRFSTFIEQSFMDLGRSMTPLLYKHAIENFTPIFSLRSIAKPEFIQELKDFIDPEYHFADRDPEHYISPCHRIRLELYGSYVPRARRLLKYKKEGRIFDNPPDVRCLKTYEGAPVQCQFHCIKDNPLKVYTDVTLDEEGLHGEYRNLIGCERCDTVEKRRARLNREIISTATSDDLVAFKKKPKVQKIRFVISRNSDFDVLNPNNTAHTFVSKFLQLSEANGGKLLDTYHSVEKHNLFWQSVPEFSNYLSGIQVIDTVWSEDSIKEVKSLIDSVNKVCKSLQVVSCYEVPMEDKLTIKDYNVFVFESTLPREYFSEAAIHYKGEIKVEAASNTFALEIEQDKSLQAPVFVQKQGKVVGVFVLPLKYSPVNFLASFLSAARKTSFQVIVDSTEIASQMVVRETSTVCKNCGKERGFVSLITGKYLPYGKSCLTKALLTQLSK